jgi:nicotinamidase-related amidase
MASFKTIRDPLADHLLTPQNAALVIIDFQPGLIDPVAAQARAGRQHHSAGANRETL